MDDSPTGTVVVGLDTSDNARAALAWAAHEAKLRNARLLIGHSWSMQQYRLPEAYRRDIVEGTHTAAQEFVDKAAADVRADHPGLVVAVELVDEAAVEGLLNLAQEAELLVVGHHGLNPMLTVLLGSVSQGIIAHTPVPAVVVPPAPRMGGPVVLGVAPGADAPVEFAFAEAERRGTPLQVIRAWMYPPVMPGYIAVPPVDEAKRNAEEADELERLLAPSRAAHPGVEVELDIGLALPEEALVDASATASLTVVGAHRKHARYGLPIGRVPHRVLHLARSPVAVVPD
ncbi:universal stress protein [Streptacidiphilus sp. MAP5-3]|uniref:universal stress protein n=1 Tax=unclassified Streptacidiphilus TaxID=2643834 RepID=UPI003512542D